MKVNYRTFHILVHTHLANNASVFVRVIMQRIFNWYCQFRVQVSVAEQCFTKKRYAKEVITIRTVYDQTLLNTSRIWRK